MSFISFSEFYQLHQKRIHEQTRLKQAQELHNSNFERFLQNNTLQHVEKNGFWRMKRCREALQIIDENGWNRSYHQKLFHDQFIRACARVFFKTDALGSFQRAHQAILEQNAWENLSQEVLISTPRRFGKTISVSMFAAAMLFASAAVEISIYSTCKRISQKLLRNVQKFLRIIEEGSREPKMSVIRSNMEELVLQGPDGRDDVRIVNSYPSKVINFEKERFFCFLKIFDPP
jgi:hypothetical protein